MRRLVPTPQVLRARQKWEFNGTIRPSFSETPTATQRSVWDFPRPPAIKTVHATITVKNQGVIIAQTSNAQQVLETAGAPTYYFPPDDVDTTQLIISDRQFHCEWKGWSYSLDIQGIHDVGWLLDKVYPEFEQLFGWYAFYPQRVDCYVGDEKSKPQPGGYYGGWVTKDITGPIKGAPGSQSW